MSAHMSRLAKLHALALYGFPRPLLRARTPVERLRRFSMQERYRHHGQFLRAALCCFCTVAYPFALLPEVWRYAAQLRRREGAKRSEAVRMYALALGRNVPPVEYATYSFHLPANRAAASEYLYWTDVHAMLRMNRLRGAVNADVQDKARFTAMCRQHGLPCVENIAEFRAGKLTAGSLTGQLPERLWVKPSNLNGARGATAWRFAGEFLHAERMGDPLGRTAGTSSSAPISLPAWQSLVQAQDCVVQRVMDNHPAVQDLSNGSLIVLRLNIATDAHGQAKLLGAMATLPYGERRTTSGGIGCGIDAATGTITRADLGTERVDAHPDTGAVLPGRTLPMWPAALTLALQAHRVVFPAFASLGWDVVLTPEGPLLLEANSGWGALTQQLYFGPLGLGFFGQVAAESLQFNPL